jgi:DNA-binding CsgD family transcriptional regulator
MMAAKPDLLQLADLVYQAAVDFCAWEAAVTGIGDALQAREMSFEIYDPESSARPFVLVPRSDPDYLRIYLERWASGNFMRERGLTLPAGAVYGFETFMPRREFERSPLYSEFWRRYGIDHALIINASKEGAAGSGLGFSRSRQDGPFERDEEALLQALAPHLRRAVALNLRLGRLEMERSSTAEMLDRSPDGALLVDAQARILFANAVGEELLRENIGLRVDRGCLAAQGPTKTAALRRLIGGGEEEAGGETVILSGPDGMRLTLLVLPLRAETNWLPQRPAAIVFIKDSRRGGPTREHVQQLFDLTPAQAALACQILRGDGIQAAADRLGISRATARTHLLEVFQKTGTNRQAELVRVILERSVITRGQRRGSDGGKT